MRSGVSLNAVAEDVEDLAAVGLALLLDLLQQPREDLALAGVVGDEVPQAADLLLADAVDAAEALLDPVRVPREVVVDHQVRDLEVQALAGGVGREQDLAVGVARELLGDLAALGAAHAAVDRLDGLGPAEQRADPAHEVVQRVAVLGEDDELAPPVRSVARDGERVVLEDRAQLRPLAVGVRCAHSRGGLDEVAQIEELGVELLDGARRGRRVDELILDVLELLGGELVVVELVEVTDDVRRLGLGDQAAVEDLLLAALEALGSALRASGRSPQGWTPAGAAGR